MPAVECSRSAIDWSVVDDMFESPVRVQPKPRFWPLNVRVRSELLQLPQRKNVDDLRILE